MTAIEFLKKEYPISVDLADKHYVTSANDIAYMMEKYVEAKLNELNKTTCSVCNSNKTYGTFAFHCNYCAVTTEI